MMKCTLLLFIIFIFISCGQDTEAEKVEKAILQARSYLTKNDCAKAIKILDDYISDQATNDFFVQTLTSAYACRSGYSEVVLVLDDIPGMSTAAGGFIQSLINFTTSTMDAVDNENYLYLQTALEYIHTAGFGSTNPTAANRAGIFGSSGANNIHIQMLLMSLAQLGNYYSYYGNPDATGVKGAGAGPNNCIIAYTDPDAQAAINADFPDTKGNCSLPATGHPDLPIGTPATSIPRLCESLVVFNNLLDLLSAINLSTGSPDPNLTNILTPIDALFTLTDGASYPQIRTVADLRRQDDCETYGLANPDHIQQYFAMIIESVYQ